MNHYGTIESIKQTNATVIQVLELQNAVPVAVFLFQHSYKLVINLRSRYTLDQ